jgi:mono/diheme cytochrome c family protein
MKYPVNLLTGITVLLLGLVISAGAAAQQATVADGVFTEAQVEAGQLVYDGTCKACHNMKFYQDTLKSFNRQPLIYLWETVLGTMPADNPGSLGLSEYTNVIAYILHENGFPTGDTMLDPDNGMDEINIVAP